MAVVPVRGGAADRSTHLRRPDDPSGSRTVVRARITSASLAPRRRWLPGPWTPRRNTTVLGVLLALVAVQLGILGWNRIAEVRARATFAPQDRARIDIAATRGPVGPPRPKDRPRPLVQEPSAPAGALASAASDTAAGALALADSAHTDSAKAVPAGAVRHDPAVAGVGKDSPAQVAVAIPDRTSLERPAMEPPPVAAAEPRRLDAPVSVAAPPLASPPSAARDSGVDASTRGLVFVDAAPIVVRVTPDGRAAPLPPQQVAVAAAAPQTRGVVDVRAHTESTATPDVARAAPRDTISARPPSKLRTLPGRRAAGALIASARRAATPRSVPSAVRAPTRPSAVAPPSVVVLGTPESSRLAYVSRGPSEASGISESSVWSDAVSAAVVALERARTQHEIGRYADAVSTLERGRRAVLDADVGPRFAYERWRLDRELRDAIDRALDACGTAREVALTNGYRPPRCAP